MIMLAFTRVSKRLNYALVTQRYYGIAQEDVCSTVRFVHSIDQTGLEHLLNQLLLRSGSSVSN